MSALAVIDASLAGTSNDLVTAAVFLYAFAMLGDAAEFAFGRRARRAPLVVHAIKFGGSYVSAASRAIGQYA